MKCLLLTVVFIGLTAGQQHRRAIDSKNAAILQEARYLSGDGSFGSAYVQEDGVQFKEETGLNGERKGEYSYFDPNGQKITVQYTAGKDGFQVSGDHLPRAPAPLPVPAAHQRSQYQPQQNYNHQPQQNYNHQPQQNYNHHSGAPVQSIPDTPEVAAAKAEHFRAVEEARRQQSQLQQSQPSNNNQYDQTGQYNPAYDNDNSGQYNNYQSAPQSQPQNNFNNFNGFPQSSFNNNNNFNSFQQTSTTPAPHRFFPPGKLNLNRTPDGYQYSFSSN